ncbi:efflux RND transporter periplasmic adaptor subunit [Undibacterium parvum]|uniref:HlyD family efflux transporter periplasmic adaptor subunit n=1 Tax=Undibacterium parvum TaxID=401471 RepID=A0A3S9HK43_9BURK|nr:HlyD family efflux transporter periplasmic adaptor subunit [Undibacterium parvum]AZP12482.1 HlyD family efflux transporter periplasmic adaptor subunit [Undibacterium parvum]
MPKIRLTSLLAFIAVISMSLATEKLYAHGDDDHSKDQKKTETKATTAAANGVSASFTAPQRLTDGSLFIPKALQHQLGLRTQVVSLATLAASIELNGKVIADPDSGGRVQATFSGSIMPTAKGMPVLGRKVVKGELLAYLQPVGSAIERGNQQAQQAELEAQLSIANRKLLRYEQLEGAVPQKEIEAARIERDAYKKRRDFIAASINGKVELLAPASGVISASNVVAGQIVDAREILFEIVDTKRLAVEALAYDMRIAQSLISATGLAESTALNLKFIGSGAQLKEQALALLFRISDTNAMVAVGQPVKVIVATSQAVKGIALPRAALMKNASGESIVWVHSEAERFVARRVRQQSLDASRITVIDGVHEGDRVVIAAASLLSEVR